MKPKILGVAASLRNARWGAGNERLIADLRACQDEASLKRYLSDQAKLHLQNFVDAGQAAGLPFDEIYRNLRRLDGRRGLSNSEVALAAALWSAEKAHSDIKHISLAEYFPAADVARRAPELKAHLLDADAILLAGPVYFGDRGSLAQALVDFIDADPELRMGLRNKVYGGIAVGAKRNGGQETTLIYQLLDMVNLGLLGVGNDSDTTAQYGGTGHAGDVGTMAKDEYGLWTSIGTGRRLARVATLVGLGRHTALQGKVRIMFWILQDKDGRAAAYARELAHGFRARVDSTIIDVTRSHITRCIACDICPTHIDVDETYRCIIPKGRRDVVGTLHSDFMNQDAIVPVTYSAIDRHGLISNYQRFMERTRYLRHSDYVFSDVVTAPLVLEEVGAIQNMSIRMATSMLRHHTIVAEPMVAYLHHGAVLNTDHVVEKFARLVERARLVAAGRLRAFTDENRAAAKYNPVGYVLGTAKDNEDQQLETRAAMIAVREMHLAADARTRLGHDVATYAAISS